MEIIEENNIFDITQHHQQNHITLSSVNNFNLSKQLKMQHPTIYFQCKHPKIVKSKQEPDNNQYQYCYECGVYIPYSTDKESQILAYKTGKLDYDGFFDPKSVYHKLKLQQFEKFTIKLSQYCQNRSRFVDWIFDVGKKFNFGTNTIHLAVYLLDYVMSKLPTQIEKLELYAASCLLLAAKAIELDERIPFISSFKKTVFISYNKFEFQKSENQVCSLTNWLFIKSTIYEIVQHILSQGVVFSDDKIQDNYIIKRVENDIEDIIQQQDLSEKQDSVVEELSSNNINTTQTSPLEVTTKELIQEKETTNTTTTPTTQTQDNSMINLEKENYSEKATDQIPEIDKICQKLKNINLDLDFEEKQCVEQYQSKKIQVDKDENGNITQKFIYNVVSKIESDSAIISNLIIKDIEYLEYDFTIMSAAIIAFLRKINNITPIWNQHLTQITDVSEQDLDQCLQYLIKKFQNGFQQFSHQQNMSEYFFKKQHSTISNIYQPDQQQNNYNNNNSSTSSISLMKMQSQQNLFHKDSYNQSTNHLQPAISTQYDYLSKNSQPGTRAPLLRSYTDNFFGNSNNNNHGKYRDNTETTEYMHRNLLKNVENLGNIGENYPNPNTTSNLQNQNSYKKDNSFNFYLRNMNREKKFQPLFPQDNSSVSNISSSNTALASQKQQDFRHFASNINEKLNNIQGQIQQQKNYLLSKYDIGLNQLGGGGGGCNSSTLSQQSQININNSQSLYNLQSHRLLNSDINKYHQQVQLKNYYNNYMENIKSQLHQVKHQNNLDTSSTASSSQNNLNDTLYSSSNVNTTNNDNTNCNNGYFNMYHKQIDNSHNIC